MSAALAPFVGLVAVANDGLGSLAPLWRAFASHGVPEAGSLRFVVPKMLAADARRELERLEASGRAPFTWSLRFGEAHADPVGALAEAADEHPGADLVWIDARAVLPPLWAARLRKAALAAPGIGIAVPLCDASPLHALTPPTDEDAASTDPLRADRLAYCLGDRTYYEVPVPHLACAYFRRDALDAARPVAGEGSESLARRMRMLGFSCVVCDFLHVGVTGAAPRNLELEVVEHAAYLRNHPLGGIRRAAKDAIRLGMDAVALPGLDARPVQLHVMHFWGGGLKKWVRDFIRADASRANLILVSYRIGDDGGQRIVLYADPDSLVPLRTWDIALPIRSTATASVEYRRILEQVAAEFEVEAVIVSSLIWHSLDALALDLPTIVVCHDFYPICQAINPHFGKPCERCTPQDLERCTASNPFNTTFRDLSTAEWLVMRNRFVDLLLERRIPVVVPSPSVAATLRRLEPRLGEHPMHVIAHGIDLVEARLPAPPRAANGRLRLVVLGRHTDLKGAKLLREAAADLRAFADITLLGCGAKGVEDAKVFGWSAVERYEQSELSALLRQLAPHAGLLASVIPETFSYTLSELFALGVPPIATSLGSFRDRIVPGESGFLFEPDAASLVRAVRRLHDDPRLLANVAARLADAPLARSTADMVRDYEPLLPKGVRAIARFRVGASWQSGLTEPYRQLAQAYAQLTDAYAQLNDAYTKSQDAYRQAREGYDHVRAAYDELLAKSQGGKTKSEWKKAQG